ncbi:MAG: YkgJ family cysteine cluster protein [Candidatus Thorarchaeota archaeon]
MLNPEELRFNCTRCGNCCTDKDTLVNITYLDILRIKKSLKLDLNETLDILGFYVFEKKPSHDTYKKMVITPIETERGLAFLALLKRSSGECYFYDKKEAKCLIYSIRPMFCRTFPFSFSVSNRLTDKMDKNLKIIYTQKAKEYCLGISSDSPIIDFNFWFKIGSQTLQELEKNFVFSENWNKKVRNRQLKPTAKNYIKMILNSFEK